MSAFVYMPSTVILSLVKWTLLYLHRHITLTVSEETKRTKIVGRYSRSETHSLR